jgi:glycolate oxidase FAD binding subunit
MAETHKPASLKELEQLVAWAVAEERSLEVLGRGTKRSFGRPVDASAIVDLSRLAGVSMYEPDELVMSAGAGTPLAEIEALLAERHQELAFEPADYGPLLGAAANAASIGGVFACNLSGPRRLRSGAARDHLLGLQGVTGHGQIVKAGGRVVKNVTGYDVCKLIAGSFGTLMLTSHLTFKVLPAAPGTATLLLASHDQPALLTALRRAMTSADDVSGAAMLPPGPAARSAIPEVASAGQSVACLRLEGTTPSIAARLATLERRLASGSGLAAARLDTDPSRRLWREIRDATLLDQGLPCLWRLSCPPTEAARLADAAAPLAPEILYDWSGGLLWLAHAAADPDAGAGQLRQALAPCGGHATLVRAPEAVRRTIQPFEPQPPALAALSRRVKDSFDPKRILNPGRM